MPTATIYRRRRRRRRRRRLFHQHRVKIWHVL
jgi:hypothetical protein